MLARLAICSVVSACQRSHVLIAEVAREEVDLVVVKGLLDVENIDIVASV